jgi:NAD+ kinase
MRTVALVVNCKKRGAKKVLKDTERLLREKGIKISSKHDFVIAMGGDGTLLAAVASHGKKGIPILGVNLGGLGFLTDSTFNKLPKILDDIRKERYRIEKRMVLEATHSNHHLFGLNDFTVSTRIPGRVVEFSAVIGKEYICRFIADGIIIATPTGSTAYSLATGGPILLPNTEAIILTPISPHTLSVRPLVLPSDTEIRIEIGKKGKAILVADGQRRKMVSQSDVIQFKKANYYVKLLKPLGATFFATLREKMKWGGREDD